MWHEGNGATLGLTLPVFLGGVGATQGLLGAGGLRGSDRAVKALEGHGVGLQRSRILPPRPQQHAVLLCNSRVVLCLKKWSIKAIVGPW